MRYDNEQCSLCSERFSPDDDIVVCPECGTPVHRECWKQNGGCPNAERHGEFTWEPSVEQKDGSFDGKHTHGTICPRCGNNCAPDMLACPNCGMQLTSGDRSQESSRRIIPDLSTEEGRARFFMQGVDAKSSDEIDGAKVGDIATFVQSNTARVISKFKRIDKSKKITWNWGAFIFAEFWFIYRKMFKIGFILLAVSLAVSIVRLIPGAEISQKTAVYMDEVNAVMEEAQSGKLSNDELESRALEIYGELREKLAEKPGTLMQYGILSALLLIKHIICGLLGYWAYRKHVIDDVKAVREASSSDMMFLEHAMRYEGVSVLLFSVSFFGTQMILDYLSQYALR